MYKKKFKAKDGTEVLFREPKLSDAKDAMNYINKIACEKRSGVNINKKLKLKDEKNWLKGVISGIKKKQKVMLIVEYEGKYCGNCGIERKIWKQSHVATLGVGMSKEIREKGIGTPLIKETMNLAKKRMIGLEVLHLTVMEYNKRAQRVYEKLGFKKICKIPKEVKENGKYIDEYLMHLYVK